jgi:2-polyprenyl-3-methyl-5-hydroxy-6-metoxy-1,4-benzoquinol methylase
VTKPSPEEIAAGHAFYTKRSLAVYDLAILGYFSQVAWRCPARRVLDHYNTHVSGNHLDVGVGTGYFLDRCTYPSTPPRLALMDLNTACLEVAADRVARYQPETYEANVLEPATIDTERFDSIGMNYLLHCVPGTIRTKTVVFEHLKALANPGATMFGATLLHDGVKRNWMARQVMARNNRHGIFSNTDDDLDGLKWALAQYLTDTEVNVVGCVGLFSGRVPQMTNGDEQ